MDEAITIENLSKLYRLGLKDEMHDTFFGAAKHALKAPLRNFQRLRRLNTFKIQEEEGDDLLWALRDVSFSVQRGEAIGIIGRNGAGKSTLLKLLSRITEPTRGRITMRGRVSALLEVGTGFHPELTGRENIYLNGTILGMSKKEINQKFDEIVDFSGVERFLDTPVKRYSSGMKVRLAFSVAAHLEPEILIIDEVLAVGDAEFQAKCLGKMQDVATGDGRTVIFVSHNMGAIQQLCSRAVLLRKGELVYDGSPEEAVQKHLGYLDACSDGDLKDIPDRRCTGEAELQSIRFLNADGEPMNSFVGGKPLGIEFGYSRHSAVQDIQISFTLFNQHGVACTHLSTRFMHHQVAKDGASNTTICWIDRLPLPPGMYRISVTITADGHEADYLPSCAKFQVDSSVFYPAQVTVSSRYCPVYLEHRWEESGCPSELRAMSQT